MPVSKNYIYDGRNLKSLSLTDAEGWQTFTSDDHTSDISTLTAYRLVPYLYRGIDLRAKAISRMPWVLERIRDGRGRIEPEDVTDHPDYANLIAGMRQRLYLTEASLCLYGAAYWVKERNRVGRNLSLRCVLANSMQPIYTTGSGLTHFQRTISMNAPGAGQIQQLALKDVAYFWLPNLGAEIGPGIAPVQVALASANALHSLDLFVTGFFERGGTKLTLLTVEGNPSRDELNRLEQWWKRIAAGVRRAWQSVAIRSSVKPVVIGDGLKDTVNETLTTQRREDVCAAIGVPHSLISADAANYATSQQDTLNFYEQTAVPQALLIEEVLNDQIFGTLGLRLRFDPSRLEVYQKSELEKAAQIQALVGRPILTVEEGRTLMGYDSIPPEDEAEIYGETRRRSTEARQTKR